MLDADIKKAAIIGYLVTLLTLVSGLLLTPLLISLLGKADYGVYSLVGSIVAAFAIVNFGLNNSLVRKVASFRNSKHLEGDKLAIFLSTIVTIYIIGCTIAVLMSIVVYSGMSSFFSGLVSHEIELLKKMFVVAVVAFCINYLGSIFVGINRAYEKNVFIKTVELLRLLVRVIMILLLIKFECSAYELILVELIATIFFVLIHFLYSRKYFKFSYSYEKFNLKETKEILSYSFWVFLFAIYYQYIWEVGKISEAKVGTSETLTIVSLSIMLTLYFSSFASMIINMLLPKFVALNSEASNQSSMSELVLSSSKYIFYVLMPILIGFYYYGELFIKLWLGEGFNDVYRLVLISLLVYTPVLLQGGFSPLLESVNKVSRKAVISVLVAIICFFSGYLLNPGNIDFYYYYIGLLSIFIVQLAMNFYLMKLGFASLRCFTLNRYQIAYLAFVVISFKYSADSIKVNSFTDIFLSLLVPIISIGALLLVMFNMNNRSRWK